MQWVRGMYSNKLVCDILEYIDTFLYTKIKVEDLEHNFFYNRYYIMKLFKKEIGITIFEYINKYKIYNSIKELNTTNSLLIKTALNNGFYSLEYFSEIFKKEIGISPKQYKKIILNRQINNDKLSIITTNIININKLIDFTNRYKQNRKRDITPVKKLSIFN